MSAIKFSVEVDAGTSVFSNGGGAITNLVVVGLPTMPLPFQTTCTDTNGSERDVVQDLSFWDSKSIG